MKCVFVPSLLLGILCLSLSSKGAVYPSQYDISYHRISITVNPGVSGAISNGSVTTHFFTKAAGITQIGFDFDNAMTVSSVFYHGASISSYSFGSNMIVITFPAALGAKGSFDSVTINFSGTPVGPATTVPSGYNYSSTYKSIYTLGESFRGSTWWPCKDSLVDKIDSVDFYITTPSAYRAGANGIGSEVVSGGNRTSIWISRRPIAAYMINFAAADYSSYTFNATSLTRTVPVINYLYASPTNDFTATYKTNLNVLQTIMPAYSTVLNTEYPFWDEKYGTAECGSGWGALEVQSMTFIDRTAYAGSGYTLAHELAHQWFADKLTTGDWHHIWLNEGFAQYFESVVYPELLMSASTAATQRANLKTSVTSSSTVYVSNISNADKIFIGTGTQPYPKGAMLLSMLRAWIGDTKFFTALHDYLNAPGLAYNFTYVDSLQKYMQMQTPNDLTEFFLDWVYKQGRVTYVVKYQYVTNGVYIQLVQSPTVAGAGYFDTPVPLQIKNSSGLDTTIVILDRNGKLYNSATAQTYNANTIYYGLSQTPTIAPVFDPKSQVLATSGSITSSSTLSSLIVLPVRRINLSVADNDNDVKVNWKIESDEHIENVELQRSMDGTSFTSVFKTTPVHLSENEYLGNFTDTLFSGAQIYYRLKLEKADGTFTYSTIKTYNHVAASALVLAPNPARNYVTVSIPSAMISSKLPASLLIYDASGVLMKEQRVSAGSASVKVICSSFKSGLYKIVLINEKQRVQSQFLKQ